MKLVLGGGSVIDSSKLFFTGLNDIRNFLKVNEFDLSKQRDVDRLMAIHNEAVGYLRGQLQFDLPPELVKPANIPDLFLLASEAAGAKETRPTLRKQACSVLKTMNIINHIDGRELLYNCPISLRDIFSLVEDKMERALSSMQKTAGRHGGEAVQGGLVKYEGGRKPKESLVTKLLCRRETIAAQINDRVRYRIITKTRDDIIKTILRLFETILPFNYLIPDASVNQLIALDRQDKRSMILDSLKRHLPSYSRERDFTGRNYRVCKFVVDIPIRMDNFLATARGPGFRESLGTIAYVLVEFQIVDEETAQSNNSGDSRHENYKRRQKKGVVRRLMGR